MNISDFIYQLIHIWVNPTFWLSWIIWWWTFMYKFWYMGKYIWTHAFLEYICKSGINFLKYIPIKPILHTEVNLVMLKLNFNQIFSKFWSLLTNGFFITYTNKINSKFLTLPIWQPNLDLDCLSDFIFSLSHLLYTLQNLFMLEVLSRTLFS